MAEDGFGFDPQNLPEDLRIALGGMSGSLPPVDQDQVRSAAELAKDLTYEVGTVVDHRSLKVSGRPDPVVPLTKPLAHYDDRVFFFAGLLYGFCRLDSSVTERYRVSLGQDVSTQIHRCSAPLAEIRGFPDFVKTQVSHTLCSVENAYAAEFFEFLATQVIVDRQRNRVWHVSNTMVGVPDPFLVGAKEVPVEAKIMLFCPGKADGRFVPSGSKSMFVSTPVIAFEEYPEHEQERRRAAEESILKV